MRFVYVVLHFNTASVTFKCIDSILDNSSNYSKIVVVDNASPNGSGMLVKAKYENNKRVVVLFAEKNEGFAKGNNIGYAYAKTNLCADVIVDCNNDILFIDDEFEKKLECVVQREPTVGVVATQIIDSKDGGNHNPLSDKQMHFLKLFKHFFSYAFLYFLSFSEKLHSYCFDRIKRNDNYLLHKSNRYDIVPHGACVIFLPNFIKKSKFAFVPVTFMYGEENLLVDYLKIIKLRTFYIDSLSVIHIGSVATDNMIFTSMSKRRFYYKHAWASTVNHIVFLLKYRLFSLPI